MCACGDPVCQEVSDELLEALQAASTLAAATGPEHPTFRTFSLPDPHPPLTVSVRETPLFTDVGLTTWGAAFYLAECVPALTQHMLTLTPVRTFAAVAICRSARARARHRNGTHRALAAALCAPRTTCADRLCAGGAAKSPRQLSIQYVSRSVALAHDLPDGFKEDETLSIHSLDWEHPVGLPFQTNVIIAADVVRPLRCAH